MATNDFNDGRKTTINYSFVNANKYNTNNYNNKLGNRDLAVTLAVVGHYHNSSNIENK